MASGSLRSGTLARGALNVLVWSGARLGSQLAWVLLLARALGAANYGLFSGLAALALAMSGFVGLGLGLRMYQDASRDQEMLSLRWHQTSKLLVITSIALTGIYLAISHRLYPAANGGVLIAIALSELVFAPLVIQTVYGYTAREWMGFAAAAPVVLSMARIVAVLLLYVIPGNASIHNYAWLHASLTAIASLSLFLYGRHRLGIEPIQGALGWKDIRSGLSFSAVQASTLGITTLDKSFALLWGGEALAGRYVAANRFVSVVALPVDALVMASLPKLFRAGNNPSGASRILALLALSVGSYGLVMGTLVWFGSGLVPWLLGPSFAESMGAVRMLALYVPLYCIRILGTNALLGFGWKSWRFFCEVLTIGVLAVGIAWRAPVAGLEGAVQVVIAAEAFLSVLFWARLIYGLTRQAKTEHG